MYSRDESPKSSFTRGTQAKEAVVDHIVHLQGYSGDNDSNEYARQGETETKWQRSPGKSTLEL